ncbi:hypothetical protein IQA84_16760 [Leptospira borgpetersenii serovar Hardjo-bovis]|nr:hypothetical protein [Leptospira borgpetersenii serovar Hardjo-bovis]
MAVAPLAMLIVPLAIQLTPENKKPAEAGFAVIKRSIHTVEQQHVHAC